MNEDVREGATVNIIKNERIVNENEMK